MPPHTRDAATPDRPKGFVAAVNPLDGYRLTIDVDGTKFRFNGADITYVDRQVLRRDTGVTVREVLRMLANGEWSEPDILGALVFFARRCNGERDTLHDAAAIAEYVANAELVTITPNADDAEDDSAGEALAAN